MASINFYVDEDISIEEFYDNMSKSEKKEMYKLLIEDVEYEKTNPAQEIFNEAIDKIKSSRLQLSNEQEEMLLNLAKSL
jgi:hypothetical protein